MKKILFFLIGLLLITGCTNKSTNQLNVLNWTSYIPDDVISDFEEEYNIKVNYGTYSSNEELLAKLSSSKKGTYDVVFPSDYMVSLMKEKKMLNKINKKRFSNYDNINPLFLKQEYDSKNNYSLPFLLATSVLAVNTEHIKENIEGYKDLLNKKYENDIVLIDDQRIIIGACLQVNGYDINDTNDKHLEEAKKFFLKMKPNVKAFDSDSPKTFLMTGEVNIGLLWNAEALLAQEYNPHIKIIYPKDGYALSMDNYCIVKGSKNVDNAYLFIDYLLRDDIAKRIVAEYPYIATNRNVSQMSNKKLKKILKNGSYIRNIGSSIKKYDKTWAKMK